MVYGLIVWVLAREEIDISCVKNVNSLLVYLVFCGLFVIFAYKICRRAIAVELSALSNPL